MIPILVFASTNAPDITNQNPRIINNQYLVEISLQISGNLADYCLCLSSII